MAFFGGRLELFVDSLDHLLQILGRGRLVFYLYVGFDIAQHFVFQHQIVSTAEVLAVFLAEVAFYHFAEVAEHFQVADTVFLELFAQNLFGFGLYFGVFYFEVLAFHDFALYQSPRKFFGKYRIFSFDDLRCQVFIHGSQPFFEESFGKCDIGFVDYGIFQLKLKHLVGFCLVVLADKFLYLCTESRLIAELFVGEYLLKKLFVELRGAVAHDVGYGEGHFFAFECGNFFIIKNTQQIPYRFFFFKELFYLKFHLGIFAQADELGTCCFFELVGRDGCIRL